MRGYKIINGLIAVKNENNEFITKKAVVTVTDNVITGVEETTAENTNTKIDGYEILNAKNRLIIPGLINMHTHLYMTGLRNYADDLNFNDWLFKKIMPVEDKLSPEFAYYSSMLGCLELIRCGTTCFTDMHMFKGQSAKAAKQSGLRAYIGRGLVGSDLYVDGLPRFEEALSEKEEFCSDRIKFILSPHAIYSCSEKLLRQVSEEAEKISALKQIHISESDGEVEQCIKAHGKRPAEYLSDIGFLNNNTILAHCVKLNDEEMKTVAKSGASVVINPASNLKLGNGIAPVTKMINENINLCLGTDGAASNNTLNLFREMNILALLHSGDSEHKVNSSLILSLATENAAKALCNSRLGAIKVGAFADLTFIDLEAVSLFPNNDIISSLSHSAYGDEVKTVISNGKIIYNNGEYLTIDKDKVLGELKILCNKYL